jgi:hypothetical protein
VLRAAGGDSCCWRCNRPAQLHKWWKGNQSAALLTLLRPGWQSAGACVYTCQHVPEREFKVFYSVECVWRTVSNTKRSSSFRVSTAGSRTCLSASSARNCSTCEATQQQT